MTLQHRPDATADLTAALRERVLVLDGAMGTMIQAHGLSEADYRGERFADHGSDQQGNNDLLSLSQPELIREVHRKYLEAGADLLETNTFNAQRISLADYGMQDIAYEMNVAAASLARAEADAMTERTPDRPRWVLGTLGPTNRTASISPDVNDPGARNVTYDELVEAYLEQARGLVDGGADVLLVETIFDTLNAKAAIYALETLFEEHDRRWPVMISGTITDASGRTLSGQVTEAFWYSVRHARPLAIGLNCALGAGELRPYVAELSRIADCFVSAHPNAGLPNAFGEYDETPEAMARVVGEFATAGLVNIVGGCCGTTPEHIAAIAEASTQGSPRTPSVIPPALRLSGLEPCVVDEDSLFVNVGERTNITGSARFRRLIKEDDYGTALGVARQQVEAGAQVIDVNMDEGMIDGVAAMDRFLKLIASEPDICRVPLMIDSSKWEVIEAGLKVTQGKPIINSISMKEGEAAFLDHARLARKYGAAVVVMAFDEDGQADNLERRREICGRAYRLLVDQVGFPAEDVIIDPNIFAVATGIEEHAAYGSDFIEATALDQGEPAARVDLRRRLERLVQLPWQQRRARGDPRRVPLPRHQGRHGHGHRQRRCAAALRHRRREAARRHRGRRAQPAARRRRTAAHDRRGVPGHRRGRRRGGRGVAVAAGGRAHHARPGQGHRRVRRGGHRGAAAGDRGRRRSPARGHRGAADGRHERRGRPVRRREDVPASGREVGAGDEEGCRTPHPVHRGREGRGRQEAEQGSGRHGHGQGRRARHRQEHRRRGAAVQQLRRHRPRGHGARPEDPRHRQGGRCRHHRPVRPHHAEPGRDGSGRR